MIHRPAMLRVFHLQAVKGKLPAQGIQRIALEVAVHTKRKARKLVLVCQVKVIEVELRHVGVEPVAVLPALRIILRCEKGVDIRVAHLHRGLQPVVGPRAVEGNGAVGVVLEIYRRYFPVDGSLAHALLQQVLRVDLAR